MYMPTRAPVFGHAPGSTCTAPGLDAAPVYPQLGECLARWAILLRGGGFEGQLTRPLGWTDPVCPCYRTLYFPPFPVMEGVQVWPGIHGNPYGQQLLPDPADPAKRKFAWRQLLDELDADAAKHPHAVLFADGSRVPAALIGGDESPNSFFATETEELHLRFGRDEWPEGVEVADKQRAHDAGIRALQQQWGGGDGTVNQGCVWQNTYVDEETGFLVTEAHGDLYDEEEPVGILKKNRRSNAREAGEGIDSETCADEPCMVVPCGDYRKATGLRYRKGGKTARVGGVWCTRKFYGPGTYEITAHVPPTDAPASERGEEAGRGYVFAAWTFAYNESYAQGRTARPSKGVTAKPRDPQFVSGGKLGFPDSKWPGFNPLTDDDPDKQYTVLNSEIDIEIPANFPTLHTGEKEILGKRFGWNTINLNSWISDNEKYGERDENGLQTSWYRQIAAERDPASKKTFIAKKPEPGEPLEWHKYRFDWIVPKDGSDPYVDFWFDDQFLYRETCFVPSRSCRYNVGAWFAWWSCNGVRGEPQTFSAPFHTVKVLYKEIRITPDPNSKVVDYPQTFNQASPFLDDENGQQPICDIRTLDGELDLTAPRGGPPPAAAIPPQ